MLYQRMVRDAKGLLLTSWNNTKEVKINKPKLKKKIQTDHVYVWKT